MKTERRPTLREQLNALIQAWDTYARSKREQRQADLERERQLRAKFAEVMAAAFAASRPSSITYTSPLEEQIAEDAASRPRDPIADLIRAMEARDHRRGGTR